MVDNDDQQVAVAAATDAEAYDPSKDPRRRAKSKDPAWKYAFWPDLERKDLVQCALCNKRVHAGVGRLKRHLAGGHNDVEKCPKATAEIRKEMHDYLKKNSRKFKAMVLDEEDEAGDGEGDGAEEEVQRSSAKRKQSAASFTVVGPPQKCTKSVADMVRKTPEEVVSERHSSSTTQPTLEQCTKKTKEQQQIVNDHVADFFYENGISFNAINSRSWEILLESIGQFGPGYTSPSYHDIRLPLLERAKNKTDALKEKHELAWQEYGCSLMSDGWTDMSGHHLINFLVNSPEGTFFLESVNVSSESTDAHLLARLLEEKIDSIGREYVVQIVTDNGSNYKAAGRILMDRIPTLFWTPCAAHCLDLMLEDIGKIEEFNNCITKAKRVCRFIYRHGRILDAMRNKTGGRDLVRPAATRFATSFLTLASMFKHRQALKGLFVSEEWNENRLSTTEPGKAVVGIVLSMSFWNSVENCMRASQPLLIALRIADGDERPAMPEIWMAMDAAKTNINESLQHKQDLLKDVLAIVDKRWDNQMEQKLYGAALFLNPNKFFDIKETNKRLATRLRSMFNDVIWKMETDDDKQSKISRQADDYERTEGDCFTKKMAIKDRDKKSPLLWWGAYGGLAYELQCLAKRIISLCCSASGCERNWSTFSFIHTKKRNRLEHKRLNKLVYISYNRKMATRFQKLREQGSKGKKSNPLILEEFQWDNEWVDVNAEPVHQGGTDGGDHLTWAHVDVAIGASHIQRGRNLPRRAHGGASKSSDRPIGPHITYVPRRRRSKSRIARNVDEVEHGSGDDDENDTFVVDDEALDDDDTPPSTPHAGGASHEEGGFELDDDLDG